jgi:hypothetical protein
LSGNSSAYNNAYTEELRKNGKHNPLKCEPKSESPCATPLVLDRYQKKTDGPMIQNRRYGLNRTLLHDGNRQKKTLKRYRTSEFVIQHTKD